MKVFELIVALRSVARAGRGFFFFNGDRHKLFFFFFDRALPMSRWSWKEGYWKGNMNRAMARAFFKN